MSYPYAVEHDASGDEVLALAEDWALDGRPLPKNYRAREVSLAAANLEQGHAPRNMAVSLNVLHESVQRYRAGFPSWGWCFACDPRRFSSPKVSA